MTLGPWRVERETTDGIAEPVYRVYAGGVKVARVYDEADAAPIAAVPEMRAAMVAVARAFYTLDHLPQLNTEEVLAIRRQLGAALLKAQR